MVTNRLLVLLVVGSILSVSAGSALAQSPEEFQKRRQAIRDAMEPDSVMILRSPQPAGEGAFRQENNLYYLTGINQPGAALILYASRRAGSAVPPAGGPPATGAAAAAAVQPVLAAPAGGQRGGMTPQGRTEILFAQPDVPDTPPARGAAPAPAVPPSRPGFATVRMPADFQAMFETALLTTTGAIYLDAPRSRSLTAPLSADEQWIKAARDRGATFAVKPASPLFAALRPVKSPDEIAALKIAAEITASAQREAMRSAAPGMFEYQIQSIIEHVFTVNGAPRPGFSTIVGSGKNSCILHWSTNDRKTEPGDVVVMDIGAEYSLYTADITRTIPISGIFTKRQRDVYEVVLKANEAAIAMVAPGVNMADLNAKVNDVLTEGLVALGLIKDRSGLRQYYTHGLSHTIGLQVHDLGGANTVGVLKPGMVITIEPGLYIPAENLGVRIEDDVLVTETGNEVITAGAPKSVAEVEKLMKEPGLDFSRYLIRNPGKQ
jgi:Xaa-Pro aminopeptidase